MGPPGVAEEEGAVVVPATWCVTGGSGGVDRSGMPFCIMLAAPCMTTWAAFRGAGGGWWMPAMYGFGPLFTGRSCDSDGRSKA